MNDINEGLNFTTETESDFENRRLPSLSFDIWSGENGKRHSYYEKPMRSQILTMERSSQAENSKFSILVNELSRRFEMMDDEISTEEKIETVDHFTQQLVNSGYTQQKIKEIIVSSLKGVRRKEKRRKDMKSKYRSAEESLVERMNKKLLESTSWYKELKIREDSEEDKVISDFFKSNDGAWKDFRKEEKMGNNEFRKRKRKTQNRKKETEKPDEKIQAVLFVQHTRFSEMAKRMRAKMESLEKLGKFRVKIVERTGTKLVDILHKSNAWSLQDCERNDCLICNTESSKKGSCRQRNILYETFCITCKKKEDELKENSTFDEMGEGLEGANQNIIKNPIDGVIEVNDTPVQVETNIMKASKESSQSSQSHTNPQHSSSSSPTSPREKSPTVTVYSGGENLERANQISIKNPVNDVMVNAVNDTPVYVETKIEVMNAGKEISQRENSPVEVPDDGIVSPVYINDNTPSIDSPDIYKKGACPPPQKRKREEEEGGEVERKKNGRTDYKVKYIGESNRSGYERGREHWNQFKNMEERSHLLKHYLQHHKDIKPEEMEIGMKVKSKFKSAIERQISEAVAISREERDGTILMNSKAEYNRCKLPRLNTMSLAEQMKEAEEEKEKEMAKQIRELKKEKKARKKESDGDIDLLELCNEFIAKNDQGWRKKRRIEEANREKEDEVAKKEIERNARVNEANKKKKDLRKYLMKEGKLQRESKKESWKKLKQKMWRKYRDKDEEMYETESEEEIDIIDEAAQILEILEDLEAEREIPVKAEKRRIREEDIEGSSEVI